MKNAIATKSVNVHFTFMKNKTHWVQVFREKGLVTFLHEYVDETRSLILARNAKCHNTILGCFREQFTKYAAIARQTGVSHRALVDAYSEYLPNWFRLVDRLDLAKWLGQQGRRLTKTSYGLRTVARGETTPESRLSLLIDGLVETTDDGNVYYMGGLAADDIAEGAVKV